MQDIPETIQWLLDFANIGCEPGIFSPQLIFKDIAIKRPPVETPSSPKKPFFETSSFSEYKRRLERIENFLLKTVVGYKGNCVFSTNYWGIIRIALLCKTDDVNTKALQSYESATLGHLSLTYGSQVMKKAQEAIKEFWYKHKELHPRLKQCPCCGKFWIRKKGSNRPRVFCCAKCKNTFHQQSREDNRKCVNKSREDIKNFQQKEDYQEMIKWLGQKEQYKLKEAKEKAHKWIYLQGKSFKEYKRTVVKSMGIL